MSVISQKARCVLSFFFFFSLYIKSLLRTMSFCDISSWENREINLPVSVLKQELNGT